ncbi:hypothetical protein D9M71_434340 [compost metagenome]
MVTSMGRKNKILIRLNFMPKLRRFISAMAGYNRLFKGGALRFLLFLRFLPLHHPL